MSNFGFSDPGSELLAMIDPYDNNLYFTRVGI